MAFRVSRTDSIFGFSRVDVGLRVCSWANLRVRTCDLASTNHGWQNKWLPMNILVLLCNATQASSGTAL